MSFAVVLMRSDLGLWMRYLACDWESDGEHVKRVFWLEEAVFDVLLGIALVEIASRKSGDYGREMVKSRHP